MMMKGKQRGIAAQCHRVAVKRTPPAAAQGPEHACVADKELDEGVIDGDLHEAAKDGALVLGAGTVEVSGSALASRSMCGGCSAGSC